MRVETVGSATIYQGDCIEVMTALDSVDAVVMDPPYASGAVSESQRSASKAQGVRADSLKRLGWFTGDNIGTAGLVFLIRSVAFHALDIVKPEGSLLVFCDWRQIPNLAPAVESAGWRYQNMVVWDKGHMGMGSGFRARHEIVLHFTAGSPAYHDLGTANVIQAKRVDAEDREHQAQKPVDLLQRLLRVICPRGGLILDPFMGSGSTGVAAILEQMRFIGVDRDAKHFETARTRIYAAQAQGKLFA
jgi:DNA modification methylase